MKLEYMLTKKDKNEQNYNTSNLGKGYYLHYKNSLYYHELDKVDKKLICYGYIFDIRNPLVNVEQTMEKIIDSHSYIEELAYLNGQYILIYIEGEKIYFATDAMSLLPTYINYEMTEVSNIKTDDDKQKIYNSKLMLNIINGECTRITVENTFENTKEYILLLIKNQHKYFIEKNIILPYTSNQFMKSLIAIMKPVLYNNTLLLESNSQVDKKFAESISKDFNMNIDSLYSTDNYQISYFVRNQLFDFVPKQNVKFEESNSFDGILKDKSFNNLTFEQKSYEYAMLTRKRNQSSILAEHGVLFDPFNSHIINQALLNSEIMPKELSEYIQCELLPMLEYYDFYKNDNLKNINNDLVSQVHNLERKQITAHNEQFLLETELSPFKVSKNLDGKLKNNSIIVYPATQEIKKNEEFRIIYDNIIEGFIHIKSNYKNEKNGKTIEVRIDERVYTIDELYQGILLNVSRILKIVIIYKAARKSLPWQKAGTLIIKKK